MIQTVASSATRPVAGTWLKVINSASPSTPGPVPPPAVLKETSLPLYHVSMEAQALLQLLASARSLPKIAAADTAHTDEDEQQMVLLRPPQPLLIRRVLDSLLMVIRRVWIVAVSAGLCWVGGKRPFPFL